MRILLLDAPMRGDHPTTFIVMGADLPDVPGYRFYMAKPVTVVVDQAFEQRFDQWEQMGETVCALATHWQVSTVLMHQDDPPILRELTAATLARAGVPAVRQWMRPRVRRNRRERADRVEFMLEEGRIQWRAQQFRSEWFEMLNLGLDYMQALTEPLAHYAA